MRLMDYKVIKVYTVVSLAVNEDRTQCHDLKHNLSDGIYFITLLFKYI
jgi:hypothetical protein